MIGRVALLVTFKKAKPKPQSLSRSHIRDLGAIMDEKILSLLENPRQFWESINSKQKRRLQDVLFPHGLHYSPKTKEYRTSNIHLLLEITGCLIDTWNSEKNKTRRQNVFGSRVVAKGGIEPPTSGL